MHFGGEFRSQFLMLMLVAIGVLFALSVNNAILAWIQDKYATNLVQAYFVYALLVFLAILIVSYLFARWVIKSAHM